MNSTLYTHYERELVFIRQMANEFAKQYPAAAGRLMLGPNQSQDPHVERLIEAFALLAARVQLKLDDEFPELTDSLLGVLYPHYLAPIPSTAVVQFVRERSGTALPNGFTLERHTALRTPPVNGLPCHYRTAYPVTLWPIAITDAKLRPPAAYPNLTPPPRTQSILSLTIECHGELPLTQLSIESLRFHLTGADEIVAVLYELILNHTLQVLFRPLDGDGRAKPFVLPPGQCLAPVGFDTDEGLLDYPNTSFLGYQLLTEFFSFPPKFWFVDLGGWQTLREAGCQRKVEVLLFLGRELRRNQRALEQAITADTFRTGCTPIVNLFAQTAEPITLTGKRSEYLLTPDVHHPDGLEIVSVLDVTHSDPGTGRITEYHPFYSYRHGAPEGSAYWYTSRRQSLREGDRGTDVFLHLVDLGFNPMVPSHPAAVVRTMCCNRELPRLLRQAGDDLAFELLQAAPFVSVQTSRAPTPTLRPPLRRGAHWRLVSHLTLNHLSLSDPKEGLAALQEILRLYDFSDPEADTQLAAVTRQCIEGLIGLRSRRVVGWTGGETAGGFARGIELTVEFDESKYVGVGAYLFASVLERFFGLYATINSFTKLVARTRQSEGIMKAWPPRAGELPLV